MKQYSSLIATQTQSTDCCARIGGEEFAFLFRATHQADALKAISRLQEKVRKFKTNSPDFEFLTTFSAGVAEVRAEDKSLNDTLRRADQALYRAKEQGRDRVEIG